MAKNIIEDYLVSIGCEVNKSQFDGANNKLKALNEAFQKIGEVVKKAFAAVVTAVTTATAAFTGLTLAIVEGGKALGGITFGVQKFALNLHTTFKNAQSLKNVMDAMGLDGLEDLKYVNLVPEQRAQFMALRKLAAENAPSGQTKDGLDQLKKLGFEFQKFTIKLFALGTEFMGGIGQVLKEPIFKKVPVLLDLILTTIDLIANEVLIITGNIFKHPKEALQGAKKGALIGGVGGGVGGAIAGGLSGAATGGVGGAAIGSIFPGVGTAAGAVAGAIILGTVGAIGGGISGAGGGAAIGAGIGGVLSANQAEDKKKNFKFSSAARKTPAIQDFLDQFYVPGGRYNVGYTTNGRHSRGSKHYAGKAIDVGGAGKTDAELIKLVAAALQTSSAKKILIETQDSRYKRILGGLGGLLANDSRIGHITQPRDNEHIHISVDNVRSLAKKASRMQGGTGLGGVPGGVGATNNISFVINGAAGPQSTADTVITKLTPFLSSRNNRGFA